jgi:hypothetical protein
MKMVGSSFFEVFGSWRFSFNTNAKTARTAKNLRCLMVKGEL